MTSSQTRHRNSSYTLPSTYKFDYIVKFNDFCLKNSKISIFFIILVLKTSKIPKIELRFAIISINKRNSTIYPKSLSLTYSEIKNLNSFEINLIQFHLLAKKSEMIYIYIIRYTRTFISKNSKIRTFVEERKQSHHFRNYRTNGG